MEQIPIHYHNGTDSNSLNPNEIFTNVPQPAISKPSGGAVVDSQARTAINDIIDKLKAIGLTI